MSTIIINVLVVVVIVVSGLALTACGLVPPAENYPAKRRRKVWLVVLCALVIAASIFQAIRNELTQRSAEKKVEKQNASLESIDSFVRTFLPIKTLPTAGGFDAQKEYEAAAARAVLRLTREARVPTENNFKNISDARLPKWRTTSDFDWQKLCRIGRARVRTSI